tara:strand:- start:578 stop:1798 length:1221 start_codon:yes stop_codon:yes gene_type:complete
MAVAALPPGKKSPIDSMRSNFRGLKNNIKSMSKTVLGIQTALQKANELKRKRLETLKENRLKQKDLRQKEAEEERLEKPNFSAFSNIKESIVKTGRNLFGSVLKIVGLLAGAWLFKNIDNIKDTVEKAIKKIQEVWKGIGDFVTGTIDVVKGIAKTVLAFGKNILEFDFTDQSGRLKEAFSDVELGWQKLSGAITGAEEVFENPEKSKELDKEFEGGESDDKDNKGDKEGDDETSNNSSNVKVDPLVVLDDNKDLVPVGMYDLIKSEVEKNPSQYDTKEEINAALEKFGIDSSEVKYRKNYSSTSDENNLEKKQNNMVGKVNQQVNNAEQKIKNDKLTIEGKNKLNLDKITPKAVAETITVVAPPQRSDYANTRSGSKQYSIDLKKYNRGDDYKLLREKEALEVLN